MKFFRGSVKVPTKGPHTVSTDNLTAEVLKGKTLYTTPKVIASDGSTKVGALASTARGGTARLPVMYDRVTGQWVAKEFAGRATDSKAGSDQ